MELYCVANYINNGWTMPGLFKLICHNDRLYWAYECTLASNHFWNVQQRYPIFVSDTLFVNMDGFFKFEENHLSKVYS